MATVVAIDVDVPDPKIRIKPLAERLPDEPRLNDEMLKLTRFVSDYYLCSWGEAIETALPPKAAEHKPKLQLQLQDASQRPSARATSQNKLLQKVEQSETPLPWDLLDSSERRAARALEQLGSICVTPVQGVEVANAPPQPQSGPTPTPGQAQVLEPLLSAVDAAKFQPFLLYGSTGSGKTEVYFRAAERTLAAGRSVLYLVPEIGLTPLLLDKVLKRFPGQAVMLHSGLSARERLDGWHRIRRGEARLVVGTRSAIFAPIESLGLIVVDEEQDPSYKQDETPRYSGRDLALVRARECDAIVLLGSATPSLESFRHAQRGHYQLLELGGRVQDRPLPQVDIVDMRETYQASGEIEVLSPTLIDALGECLGRGEQALVLRNRRGWSVALLCPTCGERVQCPRCTITLTWHRSASRLRCHACAFETSRPDACGHCGAEELKLIGEGSEKIEDLLREALPEARIARMDRDTIRKRGAHAEMLRRFDSGEFNLLVGTQMIAKGHDFHRVTLVGVLSADQSLGLPDFRAGERTFQLLTQVAGRAGRGERPGRVVVQAFDPDHPILKLAQVQDYDAFYEREIRYRAALRYPPVAALVELIIRDDDEMRCQRWARSLGKAIRAQEQGRLLVAGPGPAPIERIKGRWRQQILVRLNNRRRLVAAIDAALSAVEGDVPRKAIQVDVDPLSVL
jgi:primosomal protein N' (replication factor Y)